MIASLSRALGENFLGQSATWYKQLIIAFLVINPIVFAINPFVAGWLLIIEFILTLAMLGFWSCTKDSITSTEETRKYILQWETRKHIS